MKVYVDFENRLVYTSETFEELMDSPQFAEYLENNWADYLDEIDLEELDEDDIGDFDGLTESQQDDIYDACLDDYVSENFEIFDFSEI